MLIRTRFIVFLLIFLLMVVTDLWSTEQTITSSGPMVIGREGHTATWIDGGKLLVVGGRLHNGQSIVQAEIYDPSTGTFSLTGNLNIGRYNHQATRLLGVPGRVLITGGRNETFTTGMSSAEIFDPATNSFTLLISSMTTSRYSHTASGIIENAGRVLIAGGYSSDGTTLATAELFDPATGLFTLTAGNMTISRADHQAQAFQNSKKVLIMGGANSVGTNSAVLSSAELFDPASGLFSSAGSMATPRMSFASGRYFFGDLSRIRLLIAGGNDGTKSLDSAEIYDENTGAFYNASGVMSSPRTGHTVTGLANGYLLVAGGVNDTDNVVTDQIDIFNPSTETFSPVLTMSSRRTSHSAELLSENVLLIAGGFDGITDTNTSDLVNVSSPPPITPPQIEGRWCFLTTAAHGSYLATHMEEIRKFRDRHLQTNAFGRALLNLYYRYSPPLARFIGRHELMRTLTRWAVTPVFWCVQYPITVSASIIILIAAHAYRRKRGYYQAV